jgi:amidase
MTVSATEIVTIAALDATDQAALVRSGDLTPIELVESAIDRIDRLNPTLNAVVHARFEEALVTAGGPLPAGPFTGVPFLVKDLAAEVAGWPITEGSRYLCGFVSDTDSEIARRWRRAGLVLLGRTAAPEFGMLPTAESMLFGATANPWDRTRTTGGSSGGSAAAAAAGLVPFAHGNDAGGSIRFPASACGLFGFKPTRARNPLGPRYGDIFSGLAVEHAVTRSVRDSAALLDATSGPDLGDPYPAPPVTRRFAQEVGRDPGRLRIAVSRRPPGGRLNDRPVHQDCLAALDDAVALLTALGHEVVEDDLPGLTGQVGAAIGHVYAAAMSWVIKHWTRRLGRAPRPDELDPLTVAYLEQGRSLDPGDYLLAVEDLQAFARTVARFFTTVDLWLTPTMSQPPLPLGLMVSTADDPWRAGRAAGDLVAFPAVAANITGGPAMSVPLYWSPAGLPIGVHLMGRFGDDALLFRLAGQLERARPWRDRRPPVFG